LSGFHHGILKRWMSLSHLAQLSDKGYTGCVEATCATALAASTARLA
jgi:hypothetical protein